MVYRKLIFWENQVRPMSHKLIKKETLTQVFSCEYREIWIRNIVLQSSSRFKISQNSQENTCARVLF